MKFDNISSKEKSIAIGQRDLKCDKEVSTTKKGEMDKALTIWHTFSQASAWINTQNILKLTIFVFRNVKTS